MGDLDKTPATGSLPKEVEGSGASHPTSDGVQFFVLFRHQLRTFLRTWRFLALLIVVIAFWAVLLGVQIYHGTASVVAAYGTSANYLNGLLNGIDIFAVLSASLFAGDAISSDFGHRTGYFVLTQPVRRHVFYLSRYLAASVACLLISGVFYAIPIAGAVHFFGASLPVVGLAQSWGLQSLYILALLSFVFFFSSLFSSIALSILTPLLVLLLAFPTVMGVVEFYGYEPWYLLTYAADAINQGLVHIPHAQPQTGSFTSYISYVPYRWEAIVIMISYLLIFGFLGYWIYLRKEVKG